MKNPFKFFQEVKQETFRITWPTKKETMMGAIMVFALASIAAIFFLIFPPLDIFCLKEIKFLEIDLAINNPFLSIILYH